MDYSDKRPDYGRFNYYMGIIAKSSEFSDGSFCPGHIRNNKWRLAEGGDAVFGVYSSKIPMCRQTLPNI
jgi:hypothetical protein